MKIMYLKVIGVLLVGMIGGIFSSQVLWPLLVERPLFLKYRLNQASVYINKTEQVLITENKALEDVAEKVSKAIVEIKAVKNNKTFSGTGIIATVDGLVFSIDDYFPQNADVSIYINGKPVSYKVVKRDANLGYVMAKIEESNLTTIGFTEYGSLRYGQRVFLEGMSYQKDGNTQRLVNDGVIKTFNENLIETNIVENKSLTGSPVFNIKGELVGISTIDANGKVSAIPITQIRNFLGL